MSDENVVEDLREVCEKISGLSDRKDGFLNRTEWGEINFDSAKNDAETIFSIVSTIKNLPMETLPKDFSESALGTLRDTLNILNQINNFTISQSDPSAQRDYLAKELSSYAAGVLNAIGVPLSSWILFSGRTKNLITEMEEDRAESARIMEKTVAFMRTQEAEVEKFKQTFRESAGKAGAALFTQGFAEEAEIAAKRSKKWLWPTAAFALAALWIAAVLMFGALDHVPENAWEAAYRLGGRVVAISVLSYAAVWSGRIVLANMHLANVNKHRAVSLQSLQAFHQAAADPVAKDAVVLEAARAVYENVPSGFIGRQAAEKGGYARTLEVVKGAGQIPRAGD